MNLCAASAVLSAQESGVPAHRIDPAGIRAPDPAPLPVPLVVQPETKPSVETATVESIGAEGIAAF